MEIKVGDEVQVIDENLQGKVIAIAPEAIKFICQDGFEYSYPNHLLMFIDENNEAHAQHKEHDIGKTEEVNRTIKENATPIQFSGKIPEIDLHIEILAPEVHFDIQHDALLFQLKYVEQAILEAKNKGIRNLVFIHGLGKGVLRKALRRLFDEKFPDIEYLDGNYQKYGAGATEIIIHKFSY